MSRTKTILKGIPYAVAAFASTAAVIAPVAVSAWGPDRGVYCINGSPIACPVSNPAGEVADHVVFNSIANNPAHGDERNFMQIKEKDASNSTYTDSIVLQPGKIYTVFMYYHNNASSTLNDEAHNKVGIATGTNVRAAIPALVGDTELTAVGYIKSDQSSQVWDNITLKSANDGHIALRLIPGSAKLYNHNDGKGNATKVTTLSDKIVTAEGATIGFNLDSNGNVKLDGVIPGCNEFAGYVTFDLVADQANFTVDKQVRINNDGTAKGGWQESVKANPGDIVDFVIEYTNTGSTWQNNVVIKDQLPEYLTYIEGSTYFYNATYTTSDGGYNATDDILGRGINVGNYAPGSNVLVKFSARVADKKDLPCGVTTTIENIGRVETDNGTKEDPATVYVDGGECPETPETPEIPKELPKTGTGSIVVSALGVASVTTAAAYFVRSRKNLN